MHRVRLRLYLPLLLIVITLLFIWSNSMMDANASTGQSDLAGRWFRELFDVEGIVYRGISGGTVLAEDLRLFVQKSHTPGVIGLVLETKSRGTIITTSDTVYTRENYEKRLPPGGTINKTEQEFYDNLAVIEEMKEKYSAEILFGHDYEQIVQLAEGGSIQ